MRVCILTTSYPCSSTDLAGRFIADNVEYMRESGIEVDVVSPASFRHFGVALGDGIVQNLRRRPMLLLALPCFLFSFVRAARRTADVADVVHAHWLPSAVAALATGRPFVLQVWGTDIELAKKAPWAARWLLRRAAVVVAASHYLAQEAKVLGAQEVRVIPNPVAIPSSVSDPADPPHVLYAGRLSPEKGIVEFLAAVDGLPHVIVGDGPLRDGVPHALGVVPHDELGLYFERAAIVCVPSRREGYGVVAREAMAYGRAIVATPVGGLLDAIEDGVTGLFATPPELRRTLQRLIRDRSLRERLGSAARATAQRDLTVSSFQEKIKALYAEVANRELGLVASPFVAYEPVEVVDSAAVLEREP